MLNMSLRKRKIIHIINSLDLGGAETALYHLLCAMHHDDELSVIVLNETGYYSRKMNELDIHIDYLAIKKNPIRAFYQLVSLIKRSKPDVVQTWLYHGNLIGGISAKLCGVKQIIWSVRCEGVGLKKTTNWIKHCCAWLSWIIPHQIIINSQSAVTHHCRIGYNAQKIRLIYNGFCTSLFTPNRITLQQLGETNLPSNALLIGTLARFHPDKDYSTLIQAIDTVCESHHQPVYFVLCGTGCHEKNTALNVMLQPIKYKNRVILIDGVDDPVTYLNQLDIFVLTSKTEGFPNSLAEAMLCELPCIATDVGDVKMMLAGTGLLIPHGDPKQLASMCIKMLEQTPEARAKLGALARKQIENTYSMDVNVTRMKAIYDESTL